MVLCHIPRKFIFEDGITIIDTQLGGYDHDIEGSMEFCTLVESSEFTSFISVFQSW